MVEQQVTDYYQKFRQKAELHHLQWAHLPDALEVQLYSVFGLQVTLILHACIYKPIWNHSHISILGLNDKY